MPNGWSGVLAFLLGATLMIGFSVTWKVFMG